MVDIYGHICDDTEDQSKDMPLATGCLGIQTTKLRFLVLVPGKVLYLQHTSKLLLEDINDNNGIYHPRCGWPACSFGCLSQLGCTSLWLPIAVASTA